MANRKLYASGRARQKAQQAKRTQPRNVVTMQKPKAKTVSNPKAKTASKPAAKPVAKAAAKPKTKRSIPKDATKKNAPKAGRFGGGTPKKYPTRGGGIRTNRGRITRKVGGNTAAIDSNEFLKSLGAGSAQEKIIAKMKKADKRLKR